jgi:hypothetical protein
MTLLICLVAANALLHGAVIFRFGEFFRGGSRCTGYAESVRPQETHQ